MRQSDKAAMGVALGLIGLALLGFFGSFAIQGQSLYDSFGPRIVPLAVSLLLFLLGLNFLIKAWRGGWRDPEDNDQIGPIDLPDMAWIILGLIAQMSAIALGAGFILSSALLFLLGARGFGSRKIIRDLVAGLILGFATYLLFTKGLSLGLPEGPLERGLFGWIA